MASSTFDRQLMTIGHSTLGIGSFVEMLKENCVTAIADVRSSPYSRFCPQYNTDALKRELQSNRIQYVFLGEELGARRCEEECYVQDVAKYELIARTEAFARGIQRLRTGMLTHRIAMLCAERDPLTCHRTILICRHLRNEVAINHIVGPGECESHEQAELRLLKMVGLPERDLFLSKHELLNEAYAKQGDLIAYKRTSLASANSTEEI